MLMVVLIVKMIVQKKIDNYFGRHPEPLHEEEEEEEEQVGFFETFLNLTVESRHFMVK